MRNGRALRKAVRATVATGFVLPILAGVTATARAAFGVFPGIGATQASLAPWRDLIASPGFGASLSLTLWTGLAATVLSLVIAAGAVATLHRRLSAAGWARITAPLLAAPHAALAIGLAFLIAPSGWIARLASPWATGWTVPPDIAVVGDPFGLSLILGLMMKEVPFLIFVILGGLGRLPVAAQIASGRSMGYANATVWHRVILPQVYPLIRLPVFAVLSYSLSNVDMALILGPSAPPTLAVQMTRWVQSPDLSRILPASAAALLLTGIAGLSILLWLLGELILHHAALVLLRTGRRTTPPLLPLVASAAFRLLTAAGAASLVLLLLWSAAHVWRFPDALPSEWSLSTAAAALSGVSHSALTTLLIGIATTVLSLLTAIAWLEAEDHRTRWAQALIYLPLILPQVAVLPGLYRLFLHFGIASTLPAVIWAQTLFVFPYVMIVLSDPWRAVDPRLLRSAAALGAGPWRRLCAVRLPVLLAPLLAAAALGFSVSVAQYLPTLFAGGGRIATLTTEAVTLSSGSDRRVTALYGLIQAALPLIAYALAITLPRILHRDRRGLLGGAAL
jgi:putative thiamine transport system permease protein